MRSIFAALVVGAAVSLPVPARALDTPLCSLGSSVDGTVAKVSDTCCQSVEFMCGEEGHISEAVQQGLRNIVLVVADDQGYCQYGFMHGFCSSGTTGGRAGKACRSNIDCPEGECLRRDGSTGLSASAPLRLSDFSCRYRQPPGPEKDQPCKYKVGSAEQPDRKGSKSGDKASFPFHASNFPCTTTNPGGVLPDYPVPLTPHLDRLATFGAVFPRAYVGGNACKTSRAVILYGKPHRHLLEMTDDEVGKYSIASWLLDDADGDHVLDPGETPRYWPFMLGKGEVLNETSAGFQGGNERAKPGVGKYSCTTSPSTCRGAVTAGNFEVPYEARGGGKGVGDALNIVEGRRGIKFVDKGVILRPNLAGDSVDCDACGHGEESEDCEDSCGSQLDKPFFLWFAPNQPHKKGRGEDYREIYDDGSGSYVYDTKRLKHEGRITQFDQVVGTLIDELKRHCICGWQVDPDTGDGVTSGGAKVHEKQSLWQHTVLIFLSDHGFFLPDAKRHDNENTHRTVLMVSEPRHRIIKSNGQPLLPARQYPNELVHSIDVFRTVLDYAGIPFSSGAGDPIAPASVYAGRDDYLFGRSLKAYVSDTTPPSGHIRDVVYGEHADQGNGLEDDVQRVLTRNRYLVTRPGLLGICMDAGAPVQTQTAITYDAEHNHSSTHARPCFLGASNDCPSGSCQAISRCINDPSKTCADNSDCVEVSFCSSATSGKCQYNWRGSLGDMARPVEPASGSDDSPSHACSYNSTDPAEDQKDDVAAACVPVDVELCQPLVLKMLSTFDATDPNSGHVEAAWDLNWDPDQRHDLLQDVNYLGNASSPSSHSLLAKVDACLDNYWTVNSTTGEWNGSPSGCSWAEPALP